MHPFALSHPALSVHRLRQVGQPFPPAGVRVGLPQPAGRESYGDFGLGPRIGLNNDLLQYACGGLIFIVLDSRPEDSVMSLCTRRRFILLSAGAGAGALALMGTRSSQSEKDPASSVGNPQDLGSAPWAGLARVERTSWALGAEIGLVAYHAQPSIAEAAATEALLELRRIEALMSLYRADSQVSRLNREQALPDPHPDLVGLLEIARSWSQRSQGAFDVTVQPLWEVFAEAQDKGTLPTPEAVARARARVDWRALEISRERIAFTQPNMAVTLNGLAQGFALDRVLGVLKAKGVVHALLNTGEVGALGPKPGEANPGSDTPWTVGIQHPRQPDAFIDRARLEDRCLATSGDYATCFSPDLKHHHIFDPATGYSPTALSSVTVVAKSGLDADALSTTLMVVGAERGAALLKTVPGSEALFVGKDGVLRTTEGFPLNRSQA